MPPRRIWWLPGWCAAVLVGFGILAQYSAIPGPAGRPVKHWPVETSISRSENRDTLILFLHPRCPCSSASLEEFNRLIAQAPAALEPHVVFVRPAGLPPKWEQTDLWSAAGAMPGVEVIVDNEGVEARRFGATTSGTAVLFDCSGGQLFFGGITGARGHAGDNPGKSAVLSAISSGSAEPFSPPVFGCPLFDPVMGGGSETSTP